MRRIKLLAGAAVLLVAASASYGQDSYDTALQNWKNYQDVGKWLEKNFSFDAARLQLMLGRVRAQGPTGLLARSPAKTFEMKRGYCTDSAKLAIDALNRIDPAYDAQYVFIKNKAGPAQHWVTGFKVDGKIMVMDYGASPEWWRMLGIHGPYESLDQYRDFLASLNVKGFSVDFVEWRKMPGQED